MGRKTIQKNSGPCARRTSESGTGFFSVPLPDRAEFKSLSASTLVNSGSTYPKFQMSLSDTFAAFFRVIEEQMLLLVFNCRVIDLSACMQLRFMPANSPEEITGAFSSIARDDAEALCVFPSPMLFAEYGRIVSIVAKRRLPTIYAEREGVELGGLMSYGANLADLARQTAPYVDKILKGVKPAELPVQQPTKFELVINLKTAKALGLTIPDKLLALADEMIE
jgi:hypothetical protein